MKKQRGFTLVELLAAMAIIAVLLGLAVFGINLAQRSSRDTQRRSAANDISLAVQSYYEQNGAYPTSLTFATNSVPVGTNTVNLKGGAAYRGALTATYPTGAAAPDGTGTYWFYKTTSGTTAGYAICVYLEGTTTAYNGGTDKNATCP